MALILRLELWFTYLVDDCLTKPLWVTQVILPTSNLSQVDTV